MNRFNYFITFISYEIISYNIFFFLLFTYIGNYILRIGRKINGKPSLWIYLRCYERVPRNGKQKTEQCTKELKEQGFYTYAE